MKQLLLPCLLASTLLLAFAPRGTSASIEAGPQDPTAQDEPTPLQSAMGVLQQNQRKLRKLTTDPKANRAALMEALGAMEQATISALGHAPTPRDEVPAAERELWAVGYKQAMATSLSTILDMQAATLKGDAEALKAAYGALGQQKKDGHDTYQ